MARNKISIDEKITKAEAAVATTKRKYDAALDELEKPVTKRKQLEEKKILEAYHASRRTADEIIEFLKLGERHE